MSDDPPREADASDPVLEALWSRAVDKWDDDKAHAALLDHALREQRLPDLAGRYRSLIDDADKGALAKKKLDAIVIAATSMLMTMKTPKPGKTPLPITLSAVAICVLLLAWVAWALWGRR